MKRFYSEETLKAKLKIAFTNGQNNPDAGPMSAGITANMLLLPHAPSLTLPDPGEAWTPESYAAVMVSLGKSGIVSDRFGNWWSFTGGNPLLDNATISGWSYKNVIVLESITAPITYAGKWQDSLRGPRE